MLTILRPTLLVLFFLLSCVAKVFATQVYVYEVDGNGNRIANPVTHCAGDIVLYKVDSDSDHDNTSTRIDVAGGDVVEYSYSTASPNNGAAGTSQRISSHEVVMAFHTPAEAHSCYFKVQWYSTLYQQNANIRAVIYEKLGNIGFTETSTEQNFPLLLFLPSAYPSSPQGTYTVCGTNSVSVSAYAVGAVSYTWTTNKPATQINGNGTYYATTTTSSNIQVTLPSNFVNGDFVTITVKANGSCGSSSATTTIYVQQSCSTTSSSNVTFVTSPNSTTCQPRYNVRTGTVSTATSYTATLHGGPYEGYSRTIQANPYAYYMDFPFDITGPFVGISASVTVTSPGGTSAPTYSATQNLAGGTGACRTAQTSATTSTASEQLIQSVYPNPATDQVTITGIEQDAQVVLYNALGACVKRVSLSKTTSELSINLHDLSAGIYQVSIVDGTKVLRTSKLVVQH